MGSGLIGSKEVEGLCRTELLSSEAEDCSGCVSNPAGWLADADALPRGSKLPLLLDSAAVTPHSGKSHRHTQECNLPPVPKQAAAAQTKTSLARLAKHKQLHRKAFTQQKLPGPAAVLLESSSLGGARLHISQEHTLTAINTSRVVSYTRRSVASTLREVWG